MQFKIIILMIISVSTFSNCSSELKHYQGFINMRNCFYPRDSPQNFSDPAQNIFTDHGAWFGFDPPDTNYQNLGFSRPYLMQYKYGIRLSKSLVNI